jgi:aminoglycoside phosphotransferase (APT) family kinase protein
MNHDADRLQDISDRLLIYLRHELDDGIDYAVSPTTLTGGFETRMFRFELAGAPAAWMGPLVLRILPPATPPHRATWESAVQNSLAGQSYPAPPVLHAGTDSAVLGAPFLIMRYMHGTTLMAAEARQVPSILGTAQAALHQMDAAPVMQALDARGIEEQWYHFETRLSRLSAKRDSHPWLADALQWLVDNRPPEPEQLSLCHGDFHPLNILVQGEKVSAVLDWSGFAVGDPMMDVAFTDIILSIAAREVLPVADLEQLRAGYFAAYETASPLQGERLDYYRIVRCVMALVEGAEGQDVWAKPNTVARLSKWIERDTGIPSTTIAPPPRP